MTWRRQVMRFGSVGAVGFLVDIAVFNILRATFVSPEVFEEGPILAKIVSTLTAIAVNWLGNRHWTFRQGRPAPALREGGQFLLISVVSMVIPLGCLMVSRYALGLTSALSDNISSNLIGLVLGAVFRFWLYRTWVFAPAPKTKVMTN